MKEAERLNVNRMTVLNLKLAHKYITLIRSEYHQPWCQSPGDLAQLGERQTEDLEVNRSIRLIPERIHL